MTITDSEKTRLLSLVPPNAPRGLKLNWNTKTKRWYYYLSNIQYCAEKKRGVDHRVTVGYEKDGKFFYTDHYLLLQKAQGKAIVPDDVKEATKSPREESQQTPTDQRNSSWSAHPIDIVLMVAFLSSLSGKTDCMGIADYWKTHRKFFERLFEDFPKQDISHDTVRAVLMLYQPSGLLKLYEVLAKRFLSLYSVRIAGVDSQTVKATQSTVNDEAERYLMNVDDTTNALSISQKLVSKKTDEIPAAHSLIEKLDLTGCVVTVDALHAQTKTAKLIVEAGGNYCLGLKQDQDRLYEYVSMYFARPGAGVKIARSEGKEPGYVEQRTVWVLSASLLPATFLESWLGLHEGSLIRVQAKRTTIASGECGIEDRYYISSLDFSDERIAQKALHYTRQHGGVENTLHHVLDLNFLEDRIQCKRPTYLKNRALLIKLSHSVHSKYLQWQEKHDEPIVSRSELPTLLSTAEKAADCWQKALQDSSATS